MGVRYLTESSTLGLSETIRPSPADSSVEIKPLIYEKNLLLINLDDFKDPAKFHIGMLTISLLAGLAYGGYVTYNCWREKNVFLSHVRNLVIALTCRTFFSILFEAVIILESPLDVDGGNTLKSFESICLNLVVAFWLVFTIYIHARVQRNFNSEPTLKLYMYGVPGVAVYFAMVEIFAMEGTISNQVWWLIYYVFYFHQWVVNSLRLLYLLIQLALLIDTGRMMVVKSSDNDTVSLMRKVVLMMGILVLLFWLQFGFSVGRPSFQNPQPYLYFYYLVDGSQCILVCLVLFFFNKWVPMILDKLRNITMENGEVAERLSRSNDEVLLRECDDKGIVTIDSLFMKQESGKWTNAISEDREDVVYSSVVQPQNLQKTIDLYKRLNVIPTDKVTIVEGEQFYDCNLQNDLKRSESLLFQNVPNLESKNSKLENNVSEKVVKKNAFYSSKYLIVDPKEKDIPKYLETRPCVFSREPPTNFETLEAGELLKQWLTNHSDDLEEVQQKSCQQIPLEKRKVEKEEEEVWQSTSKLLEEDQPSASKTTALTVNSVALGNLFAPKEEESLTLEENSEILKANKNSDSSLENSDVPIIHSHKNLRLRESEIKTSNYQLSNETNCKKEILNLRVAEERNFQGDNGKIIKKNEQNNVESTEIKQKGSEQNKTVNQTSQMQDNAKDGGARVIPEDPITDAILNLPSKNEIFYNSSESDLGEIILLKKKKIPTNDFLTDERVTLKDGAEAPQNRLEAETDTEKLPKTLKKSNLFGNTNVLDSETPKYLSSSKNATEENLENQTAKNLEGDRYLTYSEVLAFQPVSQRDELEKENLERKGGEFSLTSAIFSTISAAINFGGNFFRSKNEDTRSNYLTGRSPSEFF